MFLRVAVATGPNDIMQGMRTAFAEWGNVILRQSPFTAFATIVAAVILGFLNFDPLGTGQVIAEGTFLLSATALFMGAFGCTDFLRLFYPALLVVQPFAFALLFQIAQTPRTIVFATGFRMRLLVFTLCCRIFYKMRQAIRLISGATGLQIAQTASTFIRTSGYGIFQGHTHLSLGGGSQAPMSEHQTCAG